MTGKNLSSFVVSITPFDREGRIDEGALRAHLNRVAAAGVGVYLVGGGSSEAYTMSQEEMRRVLRVGFDELKGKVPVRFMGIEPRTSQEMIELARIVESVGIEMMQVYSLDIGHGRKPLENELEAYFRDILSSIHLGAILASNRAVGYSIPLPLIKRLADDYPHLVGINCNVGEPGYLPELIQLMGKRLEIFAGSPEDALACLAFGGNGFLSTEGNVAPNLCASVLKYCQAGDLTRTFDAWSRVLRLRLGINRYGGIRATKTALSILGLPGGYARKPYLPLDAVAQKEIARLLNELDIRQFEGLA